jgi:hypothetical protein
MGLLDLDIYGGLLFCCSSFWFFNRQNIRPQTARILDRERKERLIFTWRTVTGEKQTKQTKKLLILSKTK